ncbi:MAG: hypothetical protein WBP81_20685 [Solirubrobacteraceae bacterium]
MAWNEPLAADVLLDAFAIRLSEGYAAAAPTLTRALELVLARNVANDEVGRWLWLTAMSVRQNLQVRLPDYTRRAQDCPAGKSLRT